MKPSIKHWIYVVIQLITWNRKPNSELVYRGIDYGLVMYNLVVGLPSLVCRYWNYKRQLVASKIHQLSTLLANGLKSDG